MFHKPPTHSAIIKHTPVPRPELYNRVIDELGKEVNNEMSKFTEVTKLFRIPKVGRAREGSHDTKYASIQSDSKTKRYRVGRCGGKASLTLIRQEWGSK